MRETSRRICIIRHSYYPADDRPRREAEALRDAGFEVDVVCLKGPGEKTVETVDNVRAIRLPARRPQGRQTRYLADYAAFFTGASAVVAALHAKRRYAVVQANTLPDFLVFAAAVPKLSGAKVILDLHELTPELYATKFGFGMRHPLVRMVAGVEQLAAGFADAVITVSELPRRALVARGIPSEKLTIVMNSPDQRYFFRRGKPPSQEGGELRVISHGTLVERYGFDTAIRAIDLLRDRFPRINLTIMGEGEFSPTLNDLVRELGLQEHVQLIGFRPLEEVADVISRAHIGIAANRIDRFTRFILPTKLLEYVMVGVPAVVSRSPTVLEYFDESCVKFTRSDDPEDLARGIAELAIDPVGAAAMAERAAKRYLPVYGWEQRMKGRYVGLVADLAG